MKRKISLAFTLLVAIIIGNFSDLISAITNFNAFRFGINGIVSYAVTLVSTAWPLALAVLLHFNLKKSRAKAAGVVLLAAGVCNLFYAVKSAIGMITFLRTGPDIYELVMYSPLNALLSSLLMGLILVKLGMELYTGTKTKGFKALIVLAVFLIVFLGALRTMGRASMVDILNPLLMLLMLWNLGSAFTDRSKCAMTSLKAIIIIGLVAAMLFVLPEMLNGTSGGAAGSGSSKTCRSCGRSFTDSGNKNSIARTNMCTNCYNNYKWASSAIGK